MRQYTYTLALQIFHPNQDLAEPYKLLSQIEGFTPGRIWKVGDARKTPEGNLLKGNEPESYCYFDLFSYPDVNRSEDMVLSIALETVIGRLYAQKNLLHNLSESGGRIRFHIGWHHDLNVGDIFEPELLKKLSELSIGLWFDIYHYPEEKE